MMDYKDRELYLGGTTAKGYLDRTGKWRKSDWYASKSMKKGKKDEEE